MKVRIELNKMNIQRTDSKKLYKAICAQSRVLPVIDRLELIVSSIYEEAFEKNLSNLMKHSPAYYMEQVCSSTTNFVNYQLFIYLMVFVDHVYKNRNNKDLTTYPDVVTGWCMMRYNSDTQYFITGPVSSTNYKLDYKKTYQSLISPSTNMESISDYLQLMAIENVSHGVNNVSTQLANRSNAYDKLYNESQSFRIDVIASGVEENQQLYFEFDFSGNNRDANIEHKLDDEIKDNNDLIPKTAMTKFTEVLRSYNTIQIDQLVIGKYTYQTPLDIFDKVYIVFPDIIGEALTNIESKGIHSAFSIPGRFVVENTSYKFIPDFAINYKQRSVNVKKLRFTIVVPEDTLYYNKPKLVLDKVYNVNIGENAKSRVIKYYLVERLGIEHEYTWRLTSPQRNNLSMIVMYDQLTNVLYYNDNYYSVSKDDILFGKWNLDDLIQSSFMIPNEYINKTQMEAFTEAYNNTNNLYVNYIENKPISLIFDSSADYVTLNQKPVLKISDNQQKIAIKQISSIPVMLTNDESKVKLSMTLK